MVPEKAKELKGKVTNYNNVYDICFQFGGHGGHKARYLWAIL